MNKIITPTQSKTPVKIRFRMDRTAMKHKERVEFVREIPVMKQHNVGGHWHDYSFLKDLAYEIANRQVFTPPNAIVNGVDLILPLYWQFELWDDAGYISSYRIKQEIWDESVRLLPTQADTVAK